jgi:cytochrome c-type biogenesis protein CcsB
VIEIEKLFIWSGVFLYALSFLLYLISLVFGKEKLSKVALSALWVGFAAETVAIGVRWYETGHIPTVGNYENALAGSWLIILFTLYLVHRRKEFMYVSLGTIVLSMLILGIGVMSNPSLRPLNVALISFWLYVHVFFAWFAYAAYTVAFGIGVLYVMKDRKQTTGVRQGRILRKIPPLDVLDDMMFKYVVFGFITDAVMIASGSIWAKDLWGSYWSWDPVETWSLVSWLIYGLVIHLRVSLKWKGKKLAWLVICAIIGVLVTFWGVNFIVEKSMHIFNVR